MARTEDGQAPTSSPWCLNNASASRSMPFDFALVVAFAGSIKPILEVVVRLHFGEHTRSLPLTVSANERDNATGRLVR